MTQLTEKSKQFVETELKLRLFIPASAAITNLPSGFFRQKPALAGLAMLAVLGETNQSQDREVQEQSQRKVRYCTEIYSLFSCNKM